MKNTSYELLCIGTALVDSAIRGFDPVPVSSAGYRAESGVLNAGGEAVNVSVTAAKLGLRTGIFCHLGQDTAGDIVAAALTKAGVDISPVIRTAEHATPVTTMFVREDGSRQSITNNAHSYNFHPEEHLAGLPPAGAASIGSLGRAPFNDPDVVRQVIRSLSAGGSLILADMKLPNFRKLALGEIADVLPLVDYIFPNEDEAAYYSGCVDPDEMAEAFLSRGVKNVIIKLGEKGCLFKNARERIRLEAFPVRAADATGAGDNFLAGFAAKILRGAAHAEALRFASACGALCTTAAGALNGVRDRAQVEAFLEAAGDR